MCGCVIVAPSGGRCELSTGRRGRKFRTGAGAGIGIGIGIAQEVAGTTATADRGGGGKKGAVVAVVVVVEVWLALGGGYHGRPLGGLRMVAWW